MSAELSNKTRPAVISRLGRDRSLQDDPPSPALGAGPQTPGPKDSSPPQTHPTICSCSIRRPFRTAYNETRSDLPRHRDHTTPHGSERSAPTGSSGATGLGTTNRGVSDQGAHPAN